MGEGESTPSQQSQTEAQRELERAGVTVHAIGLATSFPDAEARRPLTELAAESGGRAVFVEGLDELETGLRMLPLSIALIVLLVAAYSFGWLNP